MGEKKKGEGFILDVERTVLARKQKGLDPGGRGSECEGCSHQQAHPLTRKQLGANRLPSAGGGLMPQDGWGHPEPQLCGGGGGLEDSHRWLPRMLASVGFVLFWVHVCPLTGSLRASWAESWERQAGWSYVAFHSLAL